MAHTPGYTHPIIKHLPRIQISSKAGLHTQFKKLLADPFCTLHSLKPFEHPVPIILDGLDEYNTKEAQCDFIYDHARLRTNPALIRLIRICPEWHLKKMLSNAHFGVSVDDEETKADLLLILRDGLQDIQPHFRDRLPKTWPEEAATTKIARGSFNISDKNDANLAG